MRQPREACAQSHHGGDDEAGHQDLPPVAPAEGVGDLPARLRTRLDEKDEQAELAQDGGGREGKRRDEVSVP